MGQYRSLDRKLTNNINEVGAGAAAMANLHPLEFNRGDKASVSAAVGNYKNETAIALGAFYRPDRQSMISLSGTLGYSDNMLGVGFSKSFGTPVDESAELQKTVETQNAEIKELKEKAGLVDKLKAQVEPMAKQLKELLGK